MAVDIKAKEASMDIFNADIVIITIDDPSWVDHAKNAASLVIHTIFRPLQSSAQLKRDYFLSLCKLAGEVQLV